MIDFKYVLALYLFGASVEGLRVPVSHLFGTLNLYPTPVQIGLRVKVCLCVYRERPRPAPSGIQFVDWRCCIERFSLTLSVCGSYRESENLPSVLLIWVEEPRMAQVITLTIVAVVVAPRLRAEVRILALISELLL